MNQRNFPLRREIWLLIFGRLLLQLGTGFVLVYAPIYFVNELGLSATSVGLAVGLGQLTGLLGRVLGGSLADTPSVGRQRVLILSAISSALADVALVAASDFSLLLLGNLLMGFGVGLYWPAMDALVADLTPPEASRDAYALARLADVVGLGVGIAFGGILIAVTGLYQLLFMLDGISFGVFGVLLFLCISDRPASIHEPHDHVLGWKQALGDPTLQIFVVVNIMFTLYLSQIDSTIPLYLTNIVKLDNGAGFSETMISWLFVWHIAFAAVTQLPVARFMRRHSDTRALGASAILFAAGFFGIWMAGEGGDRAIMVVMVALSILSLGMVIYAPSGAAFVIDIAPPPLRGTYSAINSMCWAVGYGMGPSLGGMALDASPAIARQYWIYLVLSGGVCLLVLTEMRRRVQRRWQRIEAEMLTPVPEECPLELHSREVRTARTDEPDSNSPLEAIAPQPRP